MVKLRPADDVKVRVLHEQTNRLVARMNDNLNIVDGTKDVQFTANSVARCIGGAFWFEDGVSGHLGEIRERVTQTHAGVEGNMDQRYQHSVGGCQPSLHEC